MSETHKIEQSTALRILRLMRELRRYELSVSEMIERLSKYEDGFKLHRSTLNKYIKVFRALNLNVVENNNRYHIDDKEKNHFILDDLYEEARIVLHDLVLTLPPTDPIRKHLITQLALYNEDVTPFIDNLIREQDLKNIDLLTEAIKTKKQVEFIGYQSTHSHRISNRIVEPKNFLGSYYKVYCCDGDTGKSKTFNLERIGEIKLLDTPQIHEVEHEKTDVFGWSSFEENVVELRLTKRAKLLLEESFPATRDLIEDDGGNKFKLRTTYTHVEPVARFILSLPGEIEVLKNENLRNYLNQQLEIEILKNKKLREYLKNQLEKQGPDKA